MHLHRHVTWHAGRLSHTRKASKGAEAGPKAGGEAGGKEEGGKRKSWATDRPLQYIATEDGRLVPVSRQRGRAGAAVQGGWGSALCHVVAYLSCGRML